MLEWLLTYTLPPVNKMQKAMLDFEQGGGRKERREKSVEKEEFYSVGGSSTKRKRALDPHS